mmetsp:Transcript_24866/g.46478  ORF Transcript_24866/g.46478 Transcript_24866/m.46478 type:complete len:87 (+) Transcript_24866:87-347(+)
MGLCRKNRRMITVWSPTTHWTFPTTYRKAALTLMLCAHRGIPCLAGGLRRKILEFCGRPWFYADESLLKREVKRPEHAGVDDNPGW